jgi:Kef-type K+ transport system membrane component KefB
MNFMILAILFAYMAYQKAKNSDRSGAKWAAIVAGAYIGTQLVVELGIGFAVGIYDVIQKKPTTTLENYWFIPTIIAIVLSILVSWLILRYLDKVPDDNFTQPPQPPSFN